jgi:hypothetical protein
MRDRNNCNPQLGQRRLAIGGNSPQAWQGVARALPNGQYGKAAFTTSGRLVEQAPALITLYRKSVELVLLVIGVLRDPLILW